jgi:drug/metabolite transporter (DMT)-like permease
MQNPSASPLSSSKLHQDAPRPLARPDIALFSMLLLIDSLHFVFARALLPYFDPAISATLVMTIATVQVGVYGWYKGLLSLHVLRRHLGFFATIGACVAASTVLTYASVGYLDAGTASMLGKMTTLFALIIGFVWLRERLRPIQVIGALVSIAGVFIISFTPGDLLQFGAFLVVISTASYAFHTAVVKRYGSPIDFLNFLFFRLLLTTVFLVAFALTRSEAWIAPPATGWWLVLIAGTVDVTISRSLYYLALRRITMSIHAIILTISPVISIVWAYFLFNTFPGPQELLGGVAVLAGVLIATRYQRAARPLPVRAQRP